MQFKFINRFKNSFHISQNIHQTWKGEPKSLKAFKNEFTAR